MSSVVPNTRLGRIEFGEAHETAFSTNAVAIGTTSAAVTAWQATVVAARAAYVLQQAALLAAKNATANLTMALDAMDSSTAAIIKQVRAKAELSGDGVYTLASLPVPQVPTARPAPGQPNSLSVALDQTGALTLGWKCANPPGTSGTMYQVNRRVGGAGGATGGGGEFEYLGSSGTKKFVDATIPAGASAITYRIQAVRSTAAGPVAEFNVNFGASGGGAMTASVVEAAPARLAA